MRRPVKYQANRGGHAPGDLREALHEFINHYWLSGNPLPPIVYVSGAPKSLTWLLGQLWNCTDLLPGRYAEALQLGVGVTYACAVRKIAEDA